MWKAPKDQYSCCKRCDVSAHSEQEKRRVFVSARCKQASLSPVGIAPGGHGLPVWQCKGRDPPATSSSAEHTGSAHPFPKACTCLQHGVRNPRRRLSTAGLHSDAERMVKGVSRVSTCPLCPQAPPVA